MAACPKEPNDPLVAEDTVIVTALYFGQRTRFYETAANIYLVCLVTRRNEKFQSPRPQRVASDKSCPLAGKVIVCGLHLEKIVRRDLREQIIDCGICAACDADLIVGFEFAAFALIFAKRKGEGPSRWTRAATDGHLSRDLGGLLRTQW